MLALFRCLSCKFSFSPDLKQLAMMGGPGRVYHSGEVRKHIILTKYSELCFKVIETENLKGNFPPKMSAPAPKRILQDNAIANLYRPRVEEGQFLLESTATN